MIVEVHEEEGEIRGHVGKSKAVVEFNAVEDEDLLVQADMPEVQVPVAIPDLSLPDPPLKKGKPAIHEPAIFLPDLVKGFRRQNRAHVFFGLGEVLLHVSAHGFNLPITGDRRAGFGMGVETGDFRG